MELYRAHQEWASRPADERFESLDALYEVTKARDDASREVLTPDVRAARVVVLDEKRLGLVDGTQPEAMAFTNWSMGQLANRLEVPRTLLPKLSLQTVADVLNDRFRLTDESLPGSALLGFNGEPNPTLRALTSQRYERLWDSRVVKATKDLLPDGWRNPVAYKGGEWGADLVPSGLYASDRDMFAFLIDGGDFADLGPDGGAHRGFFVWNSEVGNATFGFATFIFERVCGNNIIWGASDYSQMQGRHVKGVHDVYAAYERFLNSLGNGDPTAFIQAVEAARAELAVKLEATDVATLSVAEPRFKKEGFSASEVRGALAAIHQESKNATGSRWDWLQGFTAAARSLVHVDARVDLERRASKALLPAVGLGQ